MKNISSLTIYILLVIGVVITINIISDNLFFRLDFTEDNKYTLSKATEDILNDIDEPINVKAYFTEGLEPQLDKIRRDFKEMLIEYNSEADDNIIYEFINPNESEEMEREAQMLGIAPMNIRKIENDQSTLKRGYLGAIIEFGDKKEVLPSFLQGGFNMEYEFTKAIKKMTTEDKELIGVLQGHGEASVEKMPQVMTALDVLYNVENVTLTDSTKELSKYKTVMIVAPEDSLPSSHLAQLDEFLAQGKNLFIAINNVKADLQTQQGSSQTTAIEGWLANKGLQISNNFVLDKQCGTIQVVQQQGFFRMAQQIQFPYLPVVNNFEEHAITKGIEQIILEFASSITYTGDTSKIFTPLMTTSKESGSQPSNSRIEVRENVGMYNLTQANQTLAAILEGQIQGNLDSKIILVSDADFAINGEGQNVQQKAEDNINLVANSIDYLNDESGLMSLRTKTITSRPLDELEDGKRTFLKWFNFLLPIVLALIYGIIHIQRKKIIRLKRMGGDYV